VKTTIGVIADTHGFLHPAAPRAFVGVDRIIHAGDIGGPAVLHALEEIAPVIAVRGNYDLEPELQARLLPDPSQITLAGLPVLVTHRMITMDWNLNKPLYTQLFLALSPKPRLLIFGHTHFPVLEQLSSLLCLNPGYAGPDRREGPPTVARLEIDGDNLSGQILQLD